MTAKKSIGAELSVGVAGLVGWQLIDAETGVVKRESPLQPNVILDVGIDHWISGAELSSQFDGLNGSCRVGTDNTAPAASDTALGTEVAESTNRFSGATGWEFDALVPEYYYWQQQTYEFGKSEANANLTEVAMAERTTEGGVHWMRQLFRDAVGDPTTITKTNSEILRVLYEVRIYARLTDPIQSTTFNVDQRGTAVSTTIQWQPQNLDANSLFHGSASWSNVDYFGYVTGYGDNTPLDDAGAAVWTGSSPATASPNDIAREAIAEFTWGRSVDTVNDQIDFTYTFAADVFNFTGGVGAIALQILTFDDGNEGLIFFFDPKLDKTDTDELTLVFRVSVTRATI